jgi:hypothetical protein
MAKRKTTKKAHQKPNKRTLEEVNPKDPFS